MIQSLIDNRLIDLLILDQIDYFCIICQYPAKFDTEFHDIVHADDSLRHGILDAADLVVVMVPGQRIKIEKSPDRQRQQDNGHNDQDDFLEQTRTDGMNQSHEAVSSHRIARY